LKNKSKLNGVKKNSLEENLRLSKTFTMLKVAEQSMIYVVKAVDLH